MLFLDLHYLDSTYKGSVESLIITTEQNINAVNPNARQEIFFFFWSTWIQQKKYIKA